MIAMNSATAGEVAGSSRVSKARHFFAKPERYLTRNYRIPLRSRIVRQLIGDLHDGRVLDLGCGDGSMSLQFLPFSNRVTMLDYSSDMLESARRQVPAKYASQVEYVHGDIMGYTPSAAYDVVLCIGVLAHVDSVEAMIEKVAGFAKPNGRIVFQITDDDRAASRFLKWIHAAGAAFGASSLKCQSMTFSEVAAIARKQHLEIVAQQRHLFLLFPGMARLLGKWLVPYDLFTQRHPILAERGSNVMFVCRKLPSRASAHSPEGNHDERSRHD
jgi:2-polyprenyl-3-methyl-5-hydroxy-6-metoxy-1,4-benzoquinol methylase